MNDFTKFEKIRDFIGGRNIYLVGMMGSGKTKTGPDLAKLMKYKFVDMDQVIEKLTNKCISKIFDEEGEKQFRDIEKQVLSQIGQLHSVVVSTGGGIVTCSENWGILHQGIVVWLDPGKDRLLDRLSNDESRPLLKNNDIEKVINLSLIHI